MSIVGQVQRIDDRHIIPNDADAIKISKIIVLLFITINIFL